MTTLIAARAMRIGGKVVLAGETFEIAEQHARKLVAARRARPAAGGAAPAPEPKPDKPAKSRKSEEKPKGYRTRRMKAADS